jgi:hypothetical protein
MGLRISDLNFEKAFWNTVHFLNLEQKACIVRLPRKYRYTPLLTDMSLPADTVQSSKAVLLANGEAVVILSPCFPALFLFYGNSYGWNSFRTPSTRMTWWRGEVAFGVSRHGKRHRSSPPRSCNTNSSSRARLNKQRMGPPYSQVRNLLFTKKCLFRYERHDIPFST